MRPLRHACLPLALRVATASDLVQEFGSPFGQSPYSLHCLFRGLTHRSFAQLWVIMSQGFHRYYDLIRRSLELSAASSLFPQSLCVAAVRVTFPSLPCQTCSGCHHPYPARETCLVRRFREHVSIVFAENRPASTLNWFRLNWVHAGGDFRGCNVRLMLRPPDSLGHLAQPRLRVSLPPPYPSLPVYGRAFLRKVSLHPSRL